MGVPQERSPRLRGPRPVPVLGTMILAPFVALGQGFDVTVTIATVSNISAGDIFSAPDFFTRINIDNGPWHQSNFIADASNIVPGWSYTQRVFMGATLGIVPIRIELRDDDLIGSSLVDVDRYNAACGVLFGCAFSSVNRPPVDDIGLDLTLDLNNSTIIPYDARGDATGMADGTPICTPNIGGVEATICFSVTAVRAPLVVTKTTDTNDGVCSSTDCSLREAIANAAKSDRIVVPDLGQPYVLSFFDPNPTAGEPGHLKITQQNLTIEGPPSGAVIMQTVPGARVFEIHGAASVDISNISITGGQAGDNSTAFPGHKHGGGIHNHGEVTLRNVTIAGNNAPLNDQTNGGGGGFFNAGKADLINVTIADNTSALRAGGIDGNGAPGTALNMLNSLVVNNAVLNVSTGASVPANCAPSISGFVSGLGDLQFPGGVCPAPTAPRSPVLRRDAKFTYPLAPQGGAIDAGLNVVCPPRDEIGSFRPLDGDGDGVAVCDIGAREAQAAAAPPDSGDCRERCAQNRDDCMACSGPGCPLPRQCAQEYQRCIGRCR
jgi:CSLREA domain-containing protein